MTPRPRALIAEDERVLRDALKDDLALLWPELEIVAEAADGVEALRHLDHVVPDVMFLDIQMPGLTGLQLAQHIRGRCHVVFITAFDAHAIAAFEQGAIDYLLKPYDRARLALTVSRVKERLHATPTPIGLLLDELVAGARVPAVRDHLRWINASDHDTVRLIAVDDVLYLQSDHGYTRVVTDDADLLISKSLKDLQAQLDPLVFWPIHRSTIVNVHAIAGVARDLRGHMHVKLKSRTEKLPVSETQEHLFRKM